MAKISNIVCDLCGSDDIGNYITFRVKKLWTDWYEFGFERKRVHICENCLKSIKAAARYDRKIREKDNKEDED